MTEPRVRRTIEWSVLATLAAALACAGYWLLFTTFMVYDDEGYVLLSLRNFSIHGGLYDHVYTQYGPFIYLLYDALHRIFGFAFDNISGRWITLVNWLGTSVTCAALVIRTTRSALWGAFTLAGTFTYLWVMIHEPVHPGGLITMIVALTTWLGAEAWQAGRIARFTAITGLACAALVLTKINVGVFLFGAVFTWLALNSAPSSRARILTWIVAVGCAALPFALMHSLIEAPWVRQFALIFTAGALGALLAGRQSSQPTVNQRDWLGFLTWSAGTIALLCAFTLMRGTSLRGLISGVLLDPLKHPGVYFFPVKWLMGSGVVALLSLLLGACTVRFRWWENQRLQSVVVAIRILAALICMASLLGLRSTTLASSTVSYGISLVWIFSFPLGENKRTAAIRSWISLVLVFQFLQVYPVAGSQLNWGTFLWIPLLALGLHDAGPFIAAKLKRGKTIGGALTATAVIGVTVFMTQRLMRTGWDAYHVNQRLGLAGAQNLRLSNDMTYTLRIADKNLRTHADVLFSFPGLYSANIWTGLPTPTLMNATHWFSLLSPQRQQEILDELAKRPRAAMLVQRDVLDYLARTGFHTGGPLHDWLMSNFEKTVAFGGYEIWVHRGRSIGVFSTAIADREIPGVLQALILTVHGLKVPVARIDLCNVDQPDSPLVTFTAENSGMSVAPCGLDGRPLQAFAKTSFPFSVNDSALLTLRFAPIRVSGSFNRLLLVVRDQAGAVLDELLIADE